MPEVEDTSFFLSFANKITTFISFNYSAPKTVWEMHFLLRSLNNSSVFWIYPDKTFLGTPVHLTSPPHIDRDALPEPKRANSDNSSPFSTLSKRPFKAAARQAKPDAEDAIPEAVGKELTDFT